ncbi:phage tail sheath C-terminal domain-containing protein [Streptomyces sp. NPDC059928]|uniref:phage tail sheath C-terminal domain-containing protein n=1 Tax=unclassified Streptomyces TaxID=2593676 RepID=UPI00364F7142
MLTRSIQTSNARTLSFEPDWTYINVRRQINYLSESIRQSTDWAVFEPNDDQLRSSIQSSVSQFLTDQWRAGALLGTSPEQAFSVVCDESNNPPESVTAGALSIDVGVAAVRPAEFITFRISQDSGGHRWQIELGDRRVETLKGVSGVSFKQEYIQLVQNSPDEKPVPDLVLGAPEFFGTLTLTRRSMDKSENFTQWLLDSRDPAKTENRSQTIVLAYVNAQNNTVKRLQFDGARASSWSAPDLSAGDSSAADETLELDYISVTPL